MTTGSILDRIGQTPLVPLARLAAGLPCAVLGKCEYLNPGGSGKDRLARAIVDEAEAAGTLRPGMTLVEATAGNTGIGLALVAAVRGYRLVCVLPEKMSADKRTALAALGADVNSMSCGTVISSSLTITQILDLNRQSPPETSDTTYVVDSDAMLDRYIYGDELASGTMTITVPVPRVFTILLNQSVLDADGFLQTGITLTRLISKSILPATATLKLAVFDIDDASSQACKEVDKVTLNGFNVVSNTVGAPGQLGGQDNQWSVWEASVPITYLKFASYTATGAPKSALQDIRIDIAAGCREKWALAVDWAAIQIDGSVLTKMGGGAAEAIFPSSSDQIAAATGAVLSKGIPFTSTAGIVGARSLFMVFSTEPVSVSLRAPDGSAIDPAVALSTPGMNYAILQGNFLNMDGYTVQYRVDTPQPGQWQTVITAATLVTISVYTTVSDTVSLIGRFDKASYAPGEIVRLEAYFANESGIVPSRFISGTINATDGMSMTLAFVDNGTNGDTTVNDGIYTARFEAPASMGKYPSARNPYLPVNLYGATSDSTRYGMATLIVKSKTARLTSAITEGTRDADADGLFDALVLTPTINVLQTGHYRLQGSLVDAKGVSIATAMTASQSNNAPYAAGAQLMPLVFDGQTIREHGVDGPYHLSDVALFDESNSSIVIELAENVYTTTAYSAAEFENPQLSVTGGGELAIDHDANGLIDALVITLTLNTVNPGGYYWSAALMDGTGRDIGYYHAEGILTRTSPITLVVPGNDIFAHGQNGPYTLRDLSISQAWGVGKAGNGVLIDNAYATVAYTATQFESTPRSLTEILTTSVPVTSSVPGQAAQLTFNGDISINGVPYILTTTQAGLTTLLGFNGAVKAQPILAVTGTSGDVNVTVHQMNGSSVQSVIITAPDKAIFNTLASDGTYYLEVSPRKAGVYSLILSTFVSGTLPLDGAPLSVSLLRPGQYAYYTFTATAQGKPLYASIDGVAGSAAARLYLYAPGNDLPFAYLHFTAGQTQLPTPVLPATGTYTMLIVPDGIGTGAYTVTLKTR